MPLETLPYDPTDSLNTEERIEAYLGAAWESADEFKDMEKRFAYLANCFEVVLLARQRWHLSRLLH
jgi:DNA-binding phage protein